MSNQFKYAERLLYKFPVNIMRFHAAVLKLQEVRLQTDCRAQSYEQPHSSTGTHSDPTANIAEQIISLEQLITRLSRRTIAVSRVRVKLKNSHDEREREMFQLMELYYFERWTMKQIAFHLQKSESTLKRRRCELVELVLYEVHLYEVHHV